MNVIMSMPRSRFAPESYLIIGVDRGVSMTIEPWYVVIHLVHHDYHIVRQSETYNRILFEQKGKCMGLDHYNSFSTSNEQLKQHYLTV